MNEKIINAHSSSQGDELLSLLAVTFSTLAFIGSISALILVLFGVIK